MLSALKSAWRAGAWLTLKALLKAKNHKQSVAESILHEIQALEEEVAIRSESIKAPIEQPWPHRQDLQRREGNRRACRIPPTVCQTMSDQRCRERLSPAPAS